MENFWVDLLMAKKKDPEMNIDMERKVLKGILGQRYKRPLWDQIKDAIGVFFLAITILISVVLIVGITVFLIVTLIENPVSLAILCATIFLLWAWSNR